MRILKEDFPWEGHPCYALGSGARSRPNYAAVPDHKRKRIEVKCLRCDRQWVHPRGKDLFVAYCWGFEAAAEQALMRIKGIEKPQPLQLTF